MCNYYYASTAGELHRFTSAYNRDTWVAEAPEVRSVVVRKHVEGSGEEMYRAFKYAQSYQIWRPVDSHEVFAGIADEAVTPRQAHAPRKAAETTPPPRFPTEQTFASCRA